MEDQQLTTYKGILCEKWIEIILLSETYRQNLITNIPDPEKTSIYVSKLTVFWLALRMYVNKQEKGISESFKKDYNSFEKYNFNPSSLFLNNADDIPKLESILNEAVFYLGISSIGTTEA